MIIKSDNGSEWHKWDLHIHTPYSWLHNEYKNVDDKKFIKEIVSSGLSAVGITNYFRFCDKEVFSDTSLRNELEKEGIVVFLNLELRLSFQNAKKDLCDYHIIFSPELSDDKIREFLQKLEVMTGQKKESAFYLSENQLRSNTLCVAFEDLFKAIDSTNIRDQLMLGFLSRGKGESRSSSVADYILKKSDFVLHSSDNKSNIDKDFIFWARPTQDREYAMPIFQGSDAHSLADIGSKYTWIKSKITFEGLLQTKYNPAERLTFRDSNPINDKMPQHIIKKLKTANSEIIFSNDLNSLIGKRGGGKSILLKAIAQRACSKEYSSRFEEAGKIEKDLKWTGEIFGEDYKIEWGDGYISTKKQNDRNILYLPQGYLSNLAYDEYGKIEERNNFITDLLMHFDAFRNAKEASDDHRNSISIRIEEKISKTIELSDNNKILRKINSEIGDDKGLQENINKLESIIKELSEKNNITDEENTLYQESLVKTQNIIAELSIIGQDLEILKNIQNMNNGDVLALRSEILLGLSDNVKKDITDKILSSSGSSILKIIDEKSKDLYQSKITKSAELQELQKNLHKLEPKFRAQTELRELTTKKANLGKSLGTLIRNKQQIDRNIKDGDKTVDDIITLYFSYKETARAVYETVHLDFLEFSQIKFVVNFSKEAFSRTVEQNINRNKNTGLSEESKSLLRDELEEPSEEQLRNIIYDVIKDGFVFKASADNDKKQFLSSLLRNPYSINYLDSIRTRDGVGTTFDQMTGGQKAIAMLELIFKLDTNNYPILIDQPEDDLDASGITANVVDFITKQKRNRQVFIASHNANLVVCADSEEIVVADRGEDFKYLTGAIEDKEIRESIIDILEGGKDALRLRMGKMKIQVLNK